MPTDRPIIQRRTTADPQKGTGHPPAPSANGMSELLDLPLADERQSELGPIPPPSSASPPPDHTVSASRSPRARSLRSKARSPWKSLAALTFAIAAAIPLGIGIGYSLKPQPASPTLSEDLVSFGEIPAGQTAETDVKMQNDGEADLIVQGWSVIDDDSAAFRLLPSPGCTGVFLAAATACRVTVRFEPKTAGIAQARLKVITGPPDQLKTQTLPLLGQSTAPKMGIEPALAQFGEATVGYRGGRQSIFLENLGSAPLSITALHLEGLGSADFVRFGDQCSNRVLSPGSRCEVGFEFVPTTDGERRATLKVLANGPALAQSPLLIGQGRAQIPLLALQPQRLDFGAIRVGERAEPQRVDLRNDGNGALQIRTIRVTAPESGDHRSSDTLGLQADELIAGFPFEDIGCVGSTLIPGASCSFWVAFEPRLENPLGAIVQIEHSAAALAHRLPIIGTGTLPHLTLSKHQLAFGEVAVSSSSAWQTLELRNTGSAELIIESVRLRGADARRFEQSSDGCTRSAIPPRQSCTAQIRFHPRRDGPHRAELQIRANIGSSHERLPLNGLGTSARLRVDPAFLDFASVRVWQQRTLSVALRNDGRAAVTIQSVEISSRAEEEIQLTQSCVGKTLQPRQGCELRIRFSPRTPGTRNGRLLIRHSSGPQPLELAMEATGLPELSP